MMGSTPDVCRLCEGKGWGVLRNSLQQIFFTSIGAMMRCSTVYQSCVSCLDTMPQRCIGEKWRIAEMLMIQSRPTFPFHAGGPGIFSPFPS